MKTLAAIDIGSQTIRLLVARCDGAGGLAPLHKDRRIVRLGEGLHTSGRLLQSARQRAVSCLADYVLQARALGADEIAMVATAFARHAVDIDDFLAQVCRATGLRPQVISGTTEALLSFQGVRSMLSAPALSASAVVVVDIGGGSTEVVRHTPPLPDCAASLPLGVIALSECCPLHDPPLTAEVESLSRHIAHVLQAAGEICRPPSGPGCSPPLLIGTAGTATTLAAMDLRLRHYRPDLINGHRLRKAAVSSLLARMLGMSALQRCSLAGLEQGRAAVIIPGACVVLAMMDMLAVDSMLVSDAGLLEGVLIDKAAARRGAVPARPSRQT